MKKMVLSLAAMILISFTMKSQTVDELFAEYGQAKGVTRIHIGNVGMMFASLFEDTMGVDKINVLSLDACDLHFRTKADRAIRSLNDAHYETLVTVNDHDEHVRVLTKMRKNIIRELVVLKTKNNGGEIALIRIKGSIDPAHIRDVAQKYK